MELIVVIVVIAIIAAITTVAYRGVARSYRISASVNTVTSALENARAMAIRNNRYTLTTFRPTLSLDGRSQVINVIVAEWQGDSYTQATDQDRAWTYDRYVPIRGLPIRQLGEGANVAGPGWSLQYATSASMYPHLADQFWIVPSYLPKIDFDVNSEPLGRMIGVLYSPEGRVVYRNAESGADRMWIDFNMDGRQMIDSDPNRDGNTGDAIVLHWEDPNHADWADLLPLDDGWEYRNLRSTEGEPFIDVTAILSVFDERSIRAEFDIYPIWEDDEYYPLINDTPEFKRYIGYTERIIASDTDRIQFNRYSGVVMR
jgi:type II secretory pathway pseudopilin PulG